MSYGSMRRNSLLRSISGGLAMLAAMRRASSLCAGGQGRARRTTDCSLRVTGAGRTPRFRFCH
jgi:hypothetical protein